jgi:hypothetical protein
VPTAPADPTASYEPGTDTRTTDPFQTRKASLIEPALGSAGLDLPQVPGFIVECEQTTRPAAFDL